VIDFKLLLGLGAEIRTYKKGEYIIREGGKARFYLQVVSGKIKMMNIGDKGQEFIQGIFKAGESFAEPPLFLDSVYPASAVAITDSEVIVLGKNKLFALLARDFDLQMKLIRILSKRLYFKSMIGREISMYDAGHRIITLIDFLKKRDGSTDQLYEVTLTRQQIADLTGLRVETVIRAIRGLLKEELTRKGRKIYR
jgi:CRP-like cAMP-binding protein